MNVVLRDPSSALEDYLPEEIGNCVTRISRRTLTKIPGNDLAFDII